MLVRRPAVIVQLCPALTGGLRLFVVEERLSDGRPAADMAKEQVRCGFASEADVLCKTVGSAYASSNLAPATT
jgi:hypothetical protein